MSMPQIPEAKHRPNLKNTVIDLLESIALQEIALSHIVNAEAEKIQAFVGNDSNYPLGSTSKEIIEFNQSINQTMEAVVMKEWLILRKLDKVMQIQFHSDCEREHDTDLDDIIEEMELEE